MTVMQNVIEAPIQVLGLSYDEAVARCEKLLMKVGIADKAESYPGMLSGGQQQRAAIARTLAMEPKIILFDEPTSSLDPEMVGEVLGVIQALAQEGRTMLLVTHEMRFARNVSTRTIFLHAGRIEEHGTPQEVFDNPTSARCRQFVASQQQEHNKEPGTNMMFRIFAAAALAAARRFRPHRPKHSRLVPRVLTRPSTPRTRAAMSSASTSTSRRLCAPR